MTKDQELEMYRVAIYELGYDADEELANTEAFLLEYWDKDLETAIREWKAQ